jgi:hypothetical protein
MTLTFLARSRSYEAGTYLYQFGVFRLRCPRSVWQWIVRSELIFLVTPIRRRTDGTPTCTVPLWFWHMYHEANFIAHDGLRLGVVSLSTARSLNSFPRIAEPRVSDFSAWAAERFAGTLRRESYTCLWLFSPVTGRIWQTSLNMSPDWCMHSASFVRTSAWNCSSYAATHVLGRIILLAFLWNLLSVKWV